MRVLLLLCFVLSLGACTVFCRDGGEAAREAFVRQFVQSAFEDSALFKHYTSAHDRRLIDAARSRMTERFEIVHRDGYGGGSYEYGVRFANGASAVVAIYENEGEIGVVTLAIIDQPTAQ